MGISLVDMFEHRCDPDVIREFCRWIEPTCVLLVEALVLTMSTSPPHAVGKDL